MSPSSSPLPWTPSLISTELWLDSDDSSKIIFDDSLISSASTLELYVGARFIGSNGDSLEVTAVNSATSFDLVDGSGNVYNQSNGRFLNTSNVNAITFHNPSFGLSGVWDNTAKTIDWGSGAIWTYEASTRVSKWSDKSGKNNHAIQTSDAFQPSDANSDDGIEFDGSNDGFILTNDISENDISVFVVMKGDGYIFANNHTDRLLVYQIHPDPDVRMWWRLKGVHEFDRVALPNLNTLNVQIFEFSNHGTSVDARINGASEVNVSSDKKINIDRIGMKWDASTNVPTWDGNILEIIAVTSTTDREKIEGYLAHKWGLTGDLPASHIYRINAPTLSMSPSPSPLPWTPSLISTELWLDANDSNTITENSNVVSQWNDKSGNNNNVTANNNPTTGTSSENSLNVIDLDGDDSFLNLNFSLPSSGNLQAFVVCEITSNGFASDSILTMNANSNDFQIDAGASEFKGRILTDSNGNTGIGSNKITGLHIFSATFDFNSSLFTLRLDGEQMSGTSAGTYTTKLNQSQQLRVFANRGNNNFPEGRVAEVIILEDVSESSRQKVEGYLAHKWGLTGDLPASHSYRINAPTQ
tara:strand:+ start:1433 stop:3184 length:1752 start_codon:yes stop_codon:yes gene_type:complete